MAHSFIRWLSLYVGFPSLSLSTHSESIQWILARFASFRFSVTIFSFRFNRFTFPMLCTSFIRSMHTTVSSSILFFHQVRCVYGAPAHRICLSVVHLSLEVARSHIRFYGLYGPQKHFYISCLQHDIAENELSAYYSLLCTSQKFYDTLPVNDVTI